MTRVLPLALVIWLLVAGPAAGQADLSKLLVGRWEGEIAQRFVRTENPGVALVIGSVKEEGGRWIAAARAGARTGGVGPINLEIDASGSRPWVRWTSQSGIIYSLNLMDAQNLVGTATLPTSMAGQGERERPVRLQKKE